MFHGSESNNESLRPLASYFNDVRLIVPQARLKVNENGFNWFYFKGDLEIDKNSLQENIKLAKQFIEDIRVVYPDESIYIGGVSQGGIFAYELFLENPTHFDGIFCMSGFLPEHLSYPSLSKKEVFVAHGESDPVISVEVASSSAARLEQAGAHVEFKTYDMAHGVCEDELRDIGKWLVDK